MDDYVRENVDDISSNSRKDNTNAGKSNSEEFFDPVDFNLLSGVPRSSGDGCEMTQSGENNGNQKLNDCASANMKNEKYLTFKHYRLFNFVTKTSNNQYDQFIMMQNVEQRLHNLVFLFLILPYQFVLILLFISKLFVKDDQQRCTKY